MGEIAHLENTPPSIPEAARRVAVAAPAPSIELAQRLAQLLGIRKRAEIDVVVIAGSRPAAVPPRTTLSARSAGRCVDSRGNDQTRFDLEGELSHGRQAASTLAERG